jgi:hypothetical protein
MNKLKRIGITILVIAVGVIGYQWLSEMNHMEKQELAINMEQDTEGEWVSLFDGKTFDGWHIYGSDGMSDRWKIVDGAMVFTPGKKIKGVQHNLITDKTYTNFKLSLEWKISEAGNSGIFWGVFEDKKYKVPYKTGPEIQVLDDEKHPDGANGNSHRSGALYDMVAPSESTIKKVGEWNTCMIEINHKSNSGKVWLNGVHIVSFPVHGEGWDSMVSKSKFKDWKGFGKYKTGKIGLQDHGDVVSYRNIKIKEL